MKPESNKQNFISRGDFRSQSATSEGFMWMKVSTVSMGLRKDRDCIVTYDKAQYSQLCLKDSSNDLGTSAKECVWFESSHSLDLHGLLSRGKETPVSIETGMRPVVKRTKNLLSAWKVDILSPIRHSCCEGYLVIRSSRQFASTSCCGVLVAWMRD